MMSGCGVSADRLDVYQLASLDNGDNGTVIAEVTTLRGVTAFTEVVEFIVGGIVSSLVCLGAACAPGFAAAMKR